MWPVLLTGTLPFASQNPLSASVSCTHAHTILTHQNQGYAPDNPTPDSNSQKPPSQDPDQVPGALCKSFTRVKPRHRVLHEAANLAAATYRMDVNNIYICGGDPHGGLEGGEQDRAVSIPPLLHLDGEIQSHSQNQRLSQAAHLTNQFLRLERIIMVISV